MYRAVTRAGERLHEGMLRYLLARTNAESAEKVKDCLEDYIALGQQYRTTLELLQALLASSPLKCARDEAERIEGMLWRHDELLRRLYSGEKAAVGRDRPA